MGTYISITIQIIVSETLVRDSVDSSVTAALMKCCSKNEGVCRVSNEKQKSHDWYRKQAWNKRVIHVITMLRYDNNHIWYCTTWDHNQVVWFLRVTDRCQEGLEVPNMEYLEFVNPALHLYKVSETSLLGSIENVLKFRCGIEPSGWQDILL